MSRRLYAVLLMFLHRLLSADAQKGMLVAHCDSRDNAFACKVLLDMGSMHVSLALPCWGCMGREQKSGVKSRHRSKEWDTLQKPLLGPFISIPASVWAFQFPAELSHATWLNYGRSATKSQFVCQASTWRS